MNRDFIKRLLKLKEDQKITLSMAFPKKIDDGYGAFIDLGGDFYDIHDKMYDIAMNVFNTFKEEVMEKIKESELLPLYCVFLKPSTCGYVAEVGSYYILEYASEIRDSKYRKNVEMILEEFDELGKIFTKKINEIVDKYVDGFDSGNIKEYTLIYNGKSKLNRNDFMRKVDTPITVQKSEVQALIDKGIDKVVYEMATESHPELIGKNFVVRFNLVDDEKVKDIIVGLI